jgi:hypothetical protein
VPLTSISVVQTHRLGAHEAVVRLRKLLAQATEPSLFTVKRLTWDDDSKTAIFTLDIVVGSVSGRSSVTADYVKIETDKLPMIAWGPVAWAVQSRIQSKLAEALKS